jgi:hypothetical protein
MDPKEFMQKLLGLLKETAQASHAGQKTDDLVERIDALAGELDDVFDETES